MGTKYNKLHRKTLQTVEEKVSESESGFISGLLVSVSSLASSKNLERLLMIAIPIISMEIYNRKLYRKLNCCSKPKKRVHAPANARIEREEWLKKLK